MLETARIPTESADELEFARSVSPEVIPAMKKRTRMWVKKELVEAEEDHEDRGIHDLATVNNWTLLTFSECCSRAAACVLVAWAFLTYESTKTASLKRTWKLHSNSQWLRQAHNRPEILKPLGLVELAEAAAAVVVVELLEVAAQRLQRLLAHPETRTMILEKPF